MSDASADAVIDVHNLSKSFGSKKVVVDLTMRVGRGETVDLPVERFVGANPEGASAAVLAGHVRESEELWETLVTWLDGTDAGRGPWYVREGALYVARAELAAQLEQRGKGWDLPRVTRALAPFMREAVRWREGGRGTRQIRAWLVDAAALVDAGACELEAIAGRLTSQRNTCYA